MVPRGLEPRTLRLLAIRSNQLSYETSARFMRTSMPLSFCPGQARQAPAASKPAIAQLAEHLTVELCSNQMVPGSIPGGRMA